MSAAIMLLGLAPAFLNFSPTNKWLDDYSAGFKQATVMKKPLAVFVGRGAMGWNGLDAQGSLDTQAQQLLRDKYVCVFVDASVESNQPLVRQLKAGDGPALVLSDSTGEFVAYRHVGTMTKQQLASTLKTYSESMDAGVTIATDSGCGPSMASHGASYGGCGSSQQCGRSRCGLFGGHSRGCGSRGGCGTGGGCGSRGGCGIGGGCGSRGGCGIGGGCR